MRLGTWNCRGAFDRKAAAALADLVPDVLVVPECHATPEIVSEGWQYRYRNVGTKGIGVLVKDGWGVEDVDSPDGVDRRWVLPLRIRPPEGGCPPFLLLAVWAVAEKGGPSYAAQLADVLEMWAESIRSEPTVIAGDLNTSAQGVSAPEHARNVALAEELGLVSSYHRFHGVDLGDEDAMTLRWMGPGARELRFHCDLVFVPEGWLPALRSVDVGEWEAWIVANRSDHAPVMVELDDAAISVQLRESPPRQVLVRRESEEGRVDEVVRNGDVVEWYVDGELIERAEVGDPFDIWPELLIVSGVVHYTVDESLDPEARGLAVDEAGEFPGLSLEVAINGDWVVSSLGDLVGEETLVSIGDDDCWAEDLTRHGPWLVHWQDGVDSELWGTADGEDNASIAFSFAWEATCEAIENRPSLEYVSIDAPDLDRSHLEQLQSLVTEVLGDEAVVSLNGVTLPDAGGGADPG